MRTYVLAASIERLRYWIYENRVNPNDVTMVQSSDQLLGINRAVIIPLEDWPRKFSESEQEIIRERMSIVRENMQKL